LSIITPCTALGLGVRGGAVGWGTVLQTGRSRVRFPMGSLEFFCALILPVALWHWGLLSLWQKWVPGMIFRGKDGWCLGLTTLPSSCAACVEILEPQPSGTPRARPGLQSEGFTFYSTWFVSCSIDVSKNKYMPIVSVVASGDWLFNDIAFFWDVARCSFVNECRRFGGTCYFNPYSSDLGILIHLRERPWCHVYENICSLKVSQVHKMQKNCRGNVCTPPCYSLVTHCTEEG
jgi:hypothetical protein